MVLHSLWTATAGSSQEARTTDHESPVNAYLIFLRTHVFQRYCPICRSLSIYCRMFNHFGVRGYDYEKECVIREYE